jgi:predicted permease
MLSIVRTFDAIALATVAAQVGAVAYFTGSIPAAAVVGVASVGNCVFGVALALALSGAFQRNIRRGGRGKGAALGRTVFLISWGFAAASLGFLFNLVGYIVPVLDSAVSGSLSSSALPMAFSLVHPFYAGFLAASLAFPEFPRGSASLGVAAVLSFGALAAYSALALAAGRWALRLASKVARGAQTVTVRQRATDLLLKVRRPVPAYVLKDVRVASKTPATAFIFALPVLEAVVIVLELTSVGSIRAYSVLTATALGCLFTLISASVLLNTEGTGLDYTLSLPLGARVIVLAKSAVATAAYLPVPAAVGLLLLFGRPSSAWLALVPLAEVPSVLAATRAELSFFISGYRRSGRHTSRTVETRGLSLLSARDLFRLGAAMVVAGILALAPLLAYAVAFVVWRDHAPSLGALAVVSAAELGVVEALLRRP